MKIFARFIMAVIFISVCCSSVSAESKTVTADGKYVMGDMDSKQNAKALALMEAKRLALEKAGTYIESVSEVKDYQLTKDQINSLAAGVMSVEVLTEDWKMSGESMVVLVSIRATIDTSNLKARIASVQDGQGSESMKDIQGQLATLQKELAELKAKQSSPAEKAVPKEEIKAKHDGIIKQMSALELLEYGHSALIGQRWKDAMDAYNKAIAIDPNLSDAYNGMSLALQRTGQPDKAMEAVNKALKIDPQSPRGYAARAMLLQEQGKQDTALQDINKAIELSPKNARFYLQRGNLHLKMRHRDPALKDFIQSCKMGLKRACQRADVLKKRPPRDEVHGADQPPPRKGMDRRPGKPLPPRGE